MKKVLLLLALTFPLSGCLKTNLVPPAPLVNQVNDFDGQTYRSLIILQGALNSLGSSIKADPANLNSLKPAFNQASGDYNLAQAAWRIYHSTQSNQQDVTETLNKAQADVTNLQKEVQK